MLLEKNGLAGIEECYTKLLSSANRSRKKLACDSFNRPQCFFVTLSRVNIFPIANLLASFSLYEKLFVCSDVTQQLHFSLGFGQVSLQVQNITSLLWNLQKQVLSSGIILFLFGGGLIYSCSALQLMYIKENIYYCLKIICL